MPDGSRKEKRDKSELRHRKLRSPPFDPKTDIWRFSDRWTRLRLVGEIYSVFEFWIPVVTAAGNEIKIQKICLDWDPGTEELTREICPYRRAGLKGRRIYYSNAIIRCLQKKNLSMNARSSPIRVVRIPPRLKEMVDDMSALNSRISAIGEKRSYDISHPKMGADICIKINPENHFGYYSIKMDKATRITADEGKLRLFLLELKPERLEDAIRAWRLIKNDISAKAYNPLERKNSKIT